jgi:hypothetical protein
MARLQSLIVGAGMLLGVCTGAFADAVQLHGKVVDSEEAPVQGATVRLETAGFTAMTDAQGMFMLDNTAPVIHHSRKTMSIQKMHLEGHALFLTVSTSNKPVSLSLFTTQGRLVANRELSGLAAGHYRVSIGGLIPRSAGAAMYVLNSTVGETHTSFMLSGLPASPEPFSVRRMQKGSTLARASRASATVDRLIVSKFGYDEVTRELDSYQKDVGTITLNKTLIIDSTNVTDLEDSLWNLLQDRIRTLDSTEGPDDVKAIDFMSLRSGFQTIIEGDSTREKSNAGYMMSSILSLNTSSKMWRLIDSLESYSDALDENPSSEDQIMAKRRNVLGLGKRMVTAGPSMLREMATEPSLPRFLTLDYLQTAIETELIPILDDAIAAADRLIGKEEMSLSIEEDGQKYEIDKGEVFLVAAQARLSRAGLAMLCLYDMDLYAAADAQNYTWIDSLVQFDGNNRDIIRLQGDTLLQISYWDNAAPQVKLAKTFQYNLEEREEFMTIRREWHGTILEDLRAIPVILTDALNSIRAESDDQSDDILQLSVVYDMDTSMLDLSSSMREDGVSAGLAEKFRSPEALLAFVSELLEGPYTFTETIDGRELSLAVDFSAFLSNPVEDLRTILPRYVWVPEAQWLQADRNEYWANYPASYEPSPTQESASQTGYEFTVWPEDTLDIDPAAIDSIVEEVWGQKTVYLNAAVSVEIYVDSTTYIDPLRLADEQGKMLSAEEIEQLIESEMFFPYFSDYTFNGMFPEMTRTKWLDLVWGE